MHSTITISESQGRAVIQGSQRWLELKAGRFSGSEIWKLTVEPKTKKDKEAGELSETAKGHILDKLQERMSGQPKPGFSSISTDWGTENEPLAIARYEEIIGNKVDKVGFIPYGDNAGCSPDGLVSFDGLIEVKCPHVDYLVRVAEDPASKREYYCQIQFELLVTGRQWCDYIVYDPRMPEGQDISIRRILRDQDKIDELVAAMERGEEWLNEMYEELLEIFAQTQKLRA